MFGEDEKSLAGDLANYNWKIFACSVVFGNIFTNGRCDWACVLRVDRANLQASAMFVDFIPICRKQGFKNAI